MTLESITILWSPRQKCFHRETLQKTIEAGKKAFTGKAHVDYILIGIFETKAESDNFLLWAHVAKHLLYPETDPARTAPDYEESTLTGLGWIP